MNEDPLQSLEHELEEEVGLTKDEFSFIDVGPRLDLVESKTLPNPINMNVHSVSDTHKHIDMVYLVQAHTNRLQPQEGESQDINWFSPEQAVKLYEDGLLYEDTAKEVQWIFNDLLQTVDKQSKTV